MKTRKELKEEYKQMKYPMGVFQIRNLVNGKVFIGCSLDLKATWYSQKLQLNFGNHPNERLQKEWKTQGEDQFIYEILDEIKEIEGKEINYLSEINALEEMLIEKLQPFEEKGYNQKKN